MNVVEGLFYSEEHEWVKVEGDLAYIGITDYAQQSLGAIVFVELPEIEDEIVEGDVFGVIESVKAASDIYAPIDGIVKTVNEVLEDSPELLNENPYENFICCVEIKDKSQLDNLMDYLEYETFVKDEG